MAEEKMMRLSQAARKLNIGKDTIVDFLSNKGHEVENNPNAKISGDQYQMLAKEFAASAMDKEEASSLTIGRKGGQNVVIDSDEEQPRSKAADEEEEIFIKSNAVKTEPEKPAAPKETPADKKEEDSVSKPQLPGFKVVGKIDLDAAGKPKATGKKEAPKAEKPEAEKPAPEVKAEAPKVEEAPAEKPKTEEAKNVTIKPEAKEKTQPAEEQYVEKAKEETEKPKAEKPQEPKAEKPAAPVEKPAVEQKPAAEKSTPENKDQGNKEAADEKPAKGESPEAKGEQPAADTPKDKSAIVKEDQPQEKDQVISARAESLKGLTVLGKIELPAERSKKKAKPVASSDDKDKKKKKRPRKRLGKPGEAGANTGANRPITPANNQRNTGGGGAAAGGKRTDSRRPAGSRQPKEELTDKQIQEQIKETLAKLSGGGSKGGKGASRSKYRKGKRNAAAEAEHERQLQAEEDAKILKVTEFISANDLASLMNVSVNEIISTCMSLGMFVSINQRLDAEAITVIADEFGYNVEFTSEDDEQEVEVEEDAPEDLVDRAPIVTIMGHVDHGKTSLLDYIRDAKVAAGEAGGITQHIGAYDVTTESGKRVAFLDTPGHEAFTAMRARGAKVTDVVIIVVAADDNVMPQTKEAINHAQVAGVPIVIAINKIDKPAANPERIREELANINILVEDWGGKYQCQEISAKTGQGIDDLLEKVLLEAEILELKANPDKKAVGTVIEATLDKGRGYVTTILVQAGTLRIGDILLAGQHFGKVKAMFDHRGNRIKEAGPSTPVQMLGLSGAPQAGDKFNVMDSDREAREVANKREQIQREQSMRTKKHITLDEIGRRLAIGSFKELNVIVKGDVDGSVEALSDSLLKLSTEEVQVNIIHKAVGQISESDILLASASDAIVIGFQVRPSGSARKLAEQEEIEIRLYSIIYDAINELKDAMEGMLAPTVEEVITGNVEVREVFKISKVGTVAGCYVTEGFVKRNNSIRLIRDGIVVYTGDIDQLKRFKDDVQEVKQGYECGISIKNFNDIKVGDVIEGFTTQEVKRTLA
ncbi:translation initiation factor IF-2 [Nafulsella turpanensis]|uniref:translation initiation factor IF-2 n=1 Tax=Nafulsella turpanensis TaxID=1265690 RepID=UPI00034648D6|nr:translation initiation factor IF-2 [Nafulsella turpanensis]